MKDSHTTFFFFALFIALYIDEQYSATAGPAGKNV